MYLSHYKKERIADLFDDYACACEGLHLGDTNERYFIRRQAESILELVSIGIPHSLEQWAKNALNRQIISKAKYNFNNPKGNHHEQNSN
tara:strand:- start:258 stop:524 length:267 start_codon:yes stop_codon:yes gene_type:complete